MPALLPLASYLFVAATLVPSEPKLPRTFHRTINAPVTRGQMQDVPPPTDDEVLRAMNLKPQPGQRIVLNKVCDYSDPPRRYPHLGQAQLHHSLFDCRIESATGTRRAMISQNHLHVLGE